MLQKLERHFMSYIITYYLPSGLFVVVSWISFLIPPDIVPGKLSSICSVLETYDLPPNPHYLLCTHEQHYAPCISGMCAVDDIFVRSLIAIPDKEIIYYFAVCCCVGIQIRVDVVFSVSGRMALLITLFLVLVNIFNNVTTNSPKAETLTAIEIWMLACILFVFGKIILYLSI